MQECRGHRFCHYRPCPGFLLFLSFRLLRCRLVSLTSVLKDSVSAADSSFNKPPWCVCPVLMSSLSELLEVYGPIPRGAGSPDASPVSSSLSMGTIPKDDQSALVPCDSDPESPLNPTVDSDPDDDKMGGWVGGGQLGHEQRILSSHIPPCHTHMVIATILISLFCLAALQHNQTSPECCLEVTAQGGYRMFLGPPGSALPPPTGAG